MRILLLALSALFGAAGNGVTQDDATHMARSSADANDSVDLVAAAHQPRPRTKLLTVGVLDFRAPDSAPWLGTAVAEAVYAKLLGIDGVQLAERQRLRELLPEGETPQPAKLGCSVLVTGTIQHSGVWPQGRLRVSMKLIAAESGLLRGEGSFVVDDDVDGMFRLEDALVRQLGAALDRPVAASDLTRRLAANLDSQEAFGRGLSRLARAGMLPPAERAQARNLAVEAATDFQNARKRNGSFFPAAHDYEGKALELVARLQDAPAAADRVRASTVEKFRADAAEAAPAFFDLGRALQFSGDYAGALAAYRDYRAWMSGRNRILSWTIPYDDYYSPAYYTGQDRLLRCCPPDRYIFAYGDVLVMPRMNGLLCAYNRSSGAEIWRLQLPPENDQTTHIRQLLWNQATFYVLGRDEKLRLVDTLTGAVKAMVELPFFKHTHHIGRLVQFGLTDAPPVRLFVRQFANYDDQRDNLRFDELAAFDPATLRLLWQKKGRDLYANQVWLLGGRIILKEYGASARRIVLDPETGAETPDAIDPELLKLLGFDHPDIGGWFPDADFAQEPSAPVAQHEPENSGAEEAHAGWLVLATEGRRDEAAAYRIHNIRHPPQADESCQGAFLMKESGSGLQLYTTRHLEKERNQLFSRNLQSGKVARHMLRLAELSTLGYTGKGRGSSLNLEMSEDRLSVVRNTALQEIYATRPQLQLLWRYQTTGFLSGSPVLTGNGMILVSKSLQKEHAEVLKLNIPADSQTVSEADALTREGECLRQLGRNAEALEAFAAAQHSNAACLEAAYGAAQVLLEQGKPLAAWEQGRLFLNDAPATDPRRERLWRELAKACGLVWLEQPSSWPGMRYCPQRSEFIGIDNGAIRVIPLDPVKKSPRVLPHKLGGEVAVVAVQDHRLFVYANEAANPPLARLVEYDLNGPRELRTLPTPGHRRVRTAFWDTNQTMREACDRLPLLLHNADLPARFLFADPGTMQASGMFSLEEAVEPWLCAAHREDGNRAQSVEECYEVPVCTIPADRMVVIAGYSTDCEQPHYVLAGYSPQKRRVIWQTRQKMAGRAALAHRNRWHGRRIMLVPLGSRFLFSAAYEEEWIAYDTLTGTPSAMRWPGSAVWPHRLPYLLPAPMLLNTRAWIDTRPFECSGASGTAKGSTPLWPGGPMLLENCDMGKTLALAQPLLSSGFRQQPTQEWPLLGVQEDAPLVNGMMVVPPYTFLLVRVNPKRWDHFILRNDVPFYGKYPGWQPPALSGNGRDLLPIWTERPDYTPRYPLPGAAATTKP